MIQELLVIVALAGLNGVFSGAEIAVLSVRRTRIQELVDEGSHRARSLRDLRDHPERFLATVQIVITLVSVLAGLYAGASIAARLAPMLAAIPGLEDAATELAAAIVVVLVTTLQIVLGELVPKSLALRYGEAYALLIVQPFRLLASLARPFVWLLTALSNMVLRPFGDRTTFSETRLSREEILQFVDQAATAGSLDPHASEIASRALEFDELDASSLMVPRPDMQVVPRSVSVDELARLAQDGGHARLPVYDGDVDNVVGFVNLRQVLAHATAGQDVKIDAYLHPVPFVPETMAAPRVLRELQRRRSHMAVVVDEQGMVRGLVTMEDLLEELVGEIYSENDAPEEIVRRQPDGSALVLGRAPVHEVARALDLELPEGDSFSTMAGLCIDIAGRIPEAGTVLRAEGGVVLEVVEASPRRVRLVRVRREKVQTETTDEISD